MKKLQHQLQLHHSPEKLHISNRLISRSPRQPKTRSPLGHKSLLLQKSHLTPTAKKRCVIPHISSSLLTLYLFYYKSLHISFQYYTKDESERAKRVPAHVCLSFATMYVLRKVQYSNNAVEEGRESPRPSVRIITTSHCRCTVARSPTWALWACRSLRRL